MSPVLAAIASAADGEAAGGRPSEAGAAPLVYEAARAAIDRAAPAAIGGGGGEPVVAGVVLEEDPSLSAIEFRGGGGARPPLRGVSCPRCGRRGSEGRGPVDVRGAEMYLCSCRGCGASFATEVAGGD